MTVPAAPPAGDPSGEAADPQAAVNNFDNLSPEQQIEQFQSEHPGEQKPNEEPNNDPNPEDPSDPPAGEEPTPPAPQPPVEPPTPDPKPEEKPTPAGDEPDPELKALADARAEFLKSIDDEPSRKMLEQAIEMGAKEGAAKALTTIREEKTAAEKAESDAKEAEAKEVEARQAATIKEMDAAEKAGRIPAIESKAEVGSAEWLEDPAVKIRTEVFKVQTDYNAQIDKQGYGQKIESFDLALREYERQQLEKGDDAADQQAGQEQRQAGGRVLSSTGAAPAKPGSSAAQFYQPGDSLESVHAKALDALQNS